MAGSRTGNLLEFDEAFETDQLSEVSEAIASAQLCNLVLSCFQSLRKTFKTYFRVIPMP